MGKVSSSMQADAADFSQLQAENAALKKEVAELHRRLERMNELLLNAQRAQFGQSSEKRSYVLPDSEQIRVFNEAEAVQDAEGGVGTQGGPALRRRWGRLRRDRCYRNGRTPRMRTFTDTTDRGFHSKD